MFKSIFSNFFQSEFKISLLLLLISVFAYWEISLLQFSVQYDMLDVILPWRFHVGECLRYFYLPFWNPYQSTGYPIYADFQCPTWYPETILIGSVFGYSNITLHILFTFYIFISGLGVFRLTRHSGSENFPAFISGMAFMLTGVFVSNAQHFFIIVSLAWMPWVILYYLKLSENPSDFRNILILCLFTFLLISGGYQAISIVMGYLLFTFFIFYSARALIKKDYQHFFTIIKSNLIWAVITISLLTVIIISGWDVFDYVDRLHGIPLEKARENPFTFRCLISLLTPFGVASHRDFLGTDTSMANLYMGVIMLVFFLAGLFMKLKTELKILLVFGLIFLLASFGQHLPVHEIFHKFLPLMNTFRIPGFLRIFILIPVIVTGGLVINNYMKEPVKMRKLIIPAFTIIFALLIILLIISTIEINGNKFVFTSSSMDFRDKIKTASIYEQIFIHSVIQIVILIAFCILLFKNIRPGLIIPAFIFAEMVLAVQMNIIYTGCSLDFDPLSIRGDLKERPRGFPLPAPFEISKNTDGAAAFEPLWRNVNIFNKTISFDAFTSFKLKGYKFLEDQAPLLKETILRNQLVYLSDQIFDESNHSLKNIKDFLPGDLFLSRKDYMKLSMEDLKNSPGDTVFLTGFSPNEIITSTKTKHLQILTLLQSNYKGWKVFVDGHPVSHFTSNRLFISLLLPAGEHHVIFVYRNDRVIAAFIFSYSVLLVILVTLSIHYLKKNSFSPLKIILPAGLILIIIVTSIVILNNLHHNRPVRIYHKYAEMANDFMMKNNGEARCIFMVDDPLLLEKNMKESGIQVKYTVYDYCSPATISQIYNDLSKNPTGKIFFARLNVRFWPEINYLLNELYPGIREVHSTPISILFQYSAEFVSKEEYQFQSLYDFESEKEYWSGNNLFLDTTNVCSGKHSNMLDSVNSFSYTLNISRKDLSPRKKFIINMSAAVMLPEDLKAFMVLQIKRKDKTTGYFTRNIGDAVLERNIWRKVFFSKHIRSKLRPGDKILVYVWNNSKGKLWVDDLKVEVTLP